MESNRVKELWGTQFPIVEEGLSEEAVVSFVNGIMERSPKDAKEPKQSPALLKLAEETVLEAHRIADEMQEDACLATIAHAEHQAQEMVQEAWRQGQRILRAAEQHAAEVRAEAKAQAELTLLKLEASASHSLIVRA